MKLTNTQVTRLLLENWGVDNVKSIKKAEKGVVNHNWIVKTHRGNFVLRGIRKGAKLQALEFELDYLINLKKRGFPYKIPIPIKTTNGTNLIQRGKNYIWLYRFIEGEVKSSWDKPELKEMAKMLAAYHKILEESELNNKKGRIDAFLRGLIIEESEEYIKNISKKNPSRGDKVYLKEINKLLPILKSLDGRAYEKLKQYPIHRDPNPENVVWKGKKLVGVIDFENVGNVNDVLLKDIAVILQQGCSGDSKRLNISNARYFVKEYNEHKKLSSEEIELLPEMIAAIFIEDFNYVYWMLLHDPKRAKFNRLKRYSEAAQWYWKNKDKIARELR